MRSAHTNANAAEHEVQQARSVPTLFAAERISSQAVLLRRQRGTANPAAAVELGAPAAVELGAPAFAVELEALAAVESLLELLISTFCITSTTARGAGEKSVYGNLGLIDPCPDTLARRQRGLANSPADSGGSGNAPLCLSSLYLFRCGRACECPRSSRVPSPSSRR